MTKNGRSKVLFLLNTEYGLLIAYLYYKEYLENEGLQPVFIFLPSNPKRFENISFVDLPGEYYIFKNELNNGVFFPNNDFIKGLDFNNVNEIVVNNPIYFTSHIITNKVKKHNKNCKVTLLADSAGIDRYPSFKVLVLFTIKLYYRKFFNFYSFLPYKVYHYHNSNSFLDLFIAHRNLYNKQFIDSNSFIKKIFKYNIELTKIYRFDRNLYENVEIIFFTQPILNYSNINKSIKEAYVKVVSLITLFAKKHKLNVLFKLHPAESKEAYINFINSYVFIDSNNTVPAEIIINSIKNKKFISISSSASCFDGNLLNQHFWLNKMINTSNLYIDKSYSYIKNISNETELENTVFNSNLIMDND